MVKQDCGPGYEALDTIDRIIEAQSPKVDTTSGATGSSLCIQAAVYRALNSADAAKTEDEEKNSEPEKN